MKEHTPGPWVFRGTLGPASVPELRGPYVIETLSEVQIAMTCGFRCELTEANARLIAAAPELLEACEAFSEWLRHEEDGFKQPRNSPEGEAAWKSWWSRGQNLCADAQELARAAIAKAKGET